jgi:hypothetical protein
MVMSNDREAVEAEVLYQRHHVRCHHGFAYGAWSGVLGGVPLAP